MNANVQAGAARKRLRIQVPTSISRALIAPALPRLLHQYPELRLQIHDCHAIAHSVERLPAGADAALWVGSLADPALVSTRVGTVHAVVCAAPDFVERHGEPTTPDALDPEHCIGLIEPGMAEAREWVLNKGRENCWFTPTAPLAFGDVDSAIAAAVRGGGYIRVMSIEVEKEIASGRLQPVLQDWNAGCWPISVVTARDRVPSTDLAVFTRFVAGLFPTRPFRVHYLDERSSMSSAC
jgi:LysR family transcriptional regulator for bpeEF and oprC